MMYGRRSPRLEARNPKPLDTGNDGGLGFRGPVTEGKDHLLFSVGAPSGGVA